MTRCRLYVDEVGNGDLRAASNIANERYLSLTGIVTRIDLYNDQFVPQVASFKEAMLGPGGSSIVLHRREILRREAAFAKLRDAEVAADFDAGLLSLFRHLPYLATTIAIDKKEYLDAYGEWTRDPYHYCLQALLERFILWMNRNNYIGDVCIESRSKNPDRRVKEVYNNIFDHGTENINPHVVQKRLTSREIKFMIKSDNCPAMQIVDLLAHPSLRSMKLTRLNEAQPNDFGTKVVDILEKWKYARHPKTLVKEGWGKKWLPK